MASPAKSAQAAPPAATTASFATELSKLAADLKKLIDLQAHLLDQRPMLEPLLNSLSVVGSEQVEGNQQAVLDSLNKLQAVALQLTAIPEGPAAAPASPATPETTSPAVATAKPPSTS